MITYITVLDENDNDAIDYSSLDEAKHGMSMEVWYGAQDHEDTFDVLTPLEDITATMLNVYGSIVYGRFGSGSVLSIRVL